MAATGIFPSFSRFFPIGAASPQKTPDTPKKEVRGRPSDSVPILFIVLIVIDGLPTDRTPVGLFGAIEENGEHARPRQNKADQHILGDTDQKSL